MDVSTKIKLSCVLVDDNFQVRNNTFTLRVPLDEDIGGVVNYVKEVTPSVRDKDHGKFKFYKPPLDHPIRISRLHHGFQLTQKDIGDLLLVPLTVSEVFQEKGADRRFDIDVVVHIDSEEHGVIVRTLLAESSNPWLQYVTFRLRQRGDIQLPPESELRTNKIILTSRESKERPDFVEQLEQELCTRRSPTRHEIAVLPLLDSVNVLLGDTFSEYFTDANDGSETDHVTDVELLHYIDVLVDPHLSDTEAYRRRAESHIYSLLRRFAIAPTSRSPRGTKVSFDVSWTFGLAVKATEDQVIYQYTPRSDIFMSIEDFPHILVEISSDKYKGRDRHRMLLQASCLVRLGNRLLPDKSSTFFVKAFYIDNDYRAHEYTLYQKGSGLIDDESTTDLHARLSPQLGDILSSILTATGDFPYVMARRKRGAEDSASGSSKRVNQSLSSITENSVQTNVTV
ncbi:hypothetical protein EDB85DRAFT_1899000 [Lactarius pseudohatsudake]|nr:hypothetical protein EDB85DRAFT_1899000 [Lactarius pseudohatsudake]